MPINSQFLFFYVDELIQNHWVNWIEGPLSKKPSSQFQNPRGFQLSLNDLSAGPRTRAGEAYKLGMLTGRLVRSQEAGSGLPHGWQSVMEGHLPITRLGYYAYIIGRGLRSAPKNTDFQKAIDCLACTQILHIGFKTNNRWYCTALLYRYVIEETEKALGRTLENDELRYLAAATINTLESKHSDLIIQPYSSNGQLKQMLFELENSTVKRFDIRQIQHIASGSLVGINDVKKRKAALFWADPERGIFSRAARSPGARLISSLMIRDRILAFEGKESLLATTLEAINSNSENHGIFENSDALFANYPDVYEDWESLENSLFAATNTAVKDIESATIPDIWLNAQRFIRSNEAFDGSVAAKTMPLIKGQITASLQSTSSATKDKATKEKFYGLKPDVLGSYLEQGFEEIHISLPSGNAPSKNQKKSQVQRITRINFAERDANNRALGLAGEEFVFHYERKKLLRLGRPDLSKNVIWASKDIGDGLGYDIISYDKSGKRILIEVKTTNGGRATPFFLSNNEVAASDEYSDSYQLVRLFDFSTRPKFFVVLGPLNRSLNLQPTSFKARLL